MQNYVRNLVNFDISVVGHLDNFDKAAEYLARGDNVIMLANHQTEADPGKDHVHTSAIIGSCHAMQVRRFVKFLKSELWRLEDMSGFICAVWGDPTLGVLR